MPLKIDKSAKIVHDQVIFSRELLEKVKPGAVLKLFYGKGNHNNEIRHIRAIIDGDQVVYRVWRKSKQMWGYRISLMYDFALVEDSGFLKRIKNELIAT